MKNQSKLKLRSSIGCILTVHFLNSACSKNNAIIPDQLKNNALITRKSKVRAMTSDTINITYNLPLDANRNTGTLTVFLI